MPDQAGALPYRRDDEGRVLFLLVTSKAGNWIFPKGHIEAGQNAEETALTECREEAGVEGQLEAPALGRYAGRKRGRLLEVEIYLLRCEEVLDPWDEAGLREREWLDFEAARALLRPELRRLLERAEERLSG